MRLGGASDREGEPLAKLDERSYKGRGEGVGMSKGQAVYSAYFFLFFGGRGSKLSSVFF